MYEAKKEGFLPGGASLHSCMSSHGPGAYPQLSLCLLLLLLSSIESTNSFKKRRKRRKREREREVLSFSSTNNNNNNNSTDKGTFEACSKEELKPVRIPDTTLAFMFESTYMLSLTEFAERSDSLDENYLKCWQPLPKYFHD